jgi:hypothetical protein
MFTGLATHVGSSSLEKKHPALLSMDAVSFFLSQPAHSQPVPRRMPLALSPFTTRASRLVINIFLLKCEQKEEPAVSKLCMQIFYYLPFYK